MTTSSSQRVLALDIATTTGYALSASGIITSGTVCFARYKGCKSRPEEHRGQPMLNFQRWLKNRILEDKPDAIAYERVGFVKSFDVRDTLIGMRGILMLNAAYFNLPTFLYSPNHVKKYWTGHGNADKAVMIATTVMRFPDLVGADDNECDAIALLHLHLNQTDSPCSQPSPIG